MTAQVADDVPPVRSHRNGADVGILGMGLALLLCASAQLLLDGAITGVAAGSASVVLVVIGALLWGGVRGTRPRTADPVVLVLAAGGLAIDELAAAALLAPQMVALDADPAGLSLVAALLLGSAALVLGTRVAAVGTADRTSAALLAALGAALVVIVALAVHTADPLPWSRGVDVALAAAGAALAIVHGRRRRSAPQHRRRRP